MKENSYDVAIERRNRETKAIFNKAAQEAIINPTWVGSSGSFTHYNLHNYRLYFSYRKPEKGSVQRSVLGRFEFIGMKNSKEAAYRHTETGWNITIKKTQAELRKKHDARDWHLIDNAHPEAIIEINQAKRAEACRVFKAFVEDYGGSSDFNIINEYKIDNAEKNSLTKKIPINAHWEDDVSKKLYKEDKIELKNELYARNYAHNAGLNDFSPIIAKELEDIKIRLKGTGNEESHFSTSKKTASSHSPPEYIKVMNARDFLNSQGWFD